MKQYKLVNNLVGWLAFVIAAYTYCMTIEPTASFWDCPEFITTGYKLEVGHPPGAPFFMLTANLFSQFTSDPSQVARMVNTMSALMSAACILFLFWSITHLVKKLICPDDKEMTLGKLITIMGSGLVGALAYTWSDTFWFSAVEGEVYAYSSLFTAVVFWLILKWESVANEPHSDRWLVLIAYLTGLSIGVHLLNLLCIPAIVLVYYYKKNPDANLKGSLLALTGSMVLVAAVLYGIVPGVVKVGGWFELLFVNSFGMPSVGWGFQLQSPWFVALLALLFVTITLNLAGAFEFSGVRIASTGQTSGASLAGSFATGILAVVVASPCTAPFMGAALGYALSASALESFVVFVCLGLGMSLPWLLLALFPCLTAWLPRPGRWMGIFRTIMAVPMALTALWLFWVLWQQVSLSALGVYLCAAVLLAVALILYGRLQFGKAASKGFMALAFILGAGAYALAASPLLERAPVEVSTADAWSPTAVQTALDEGRPVFVDFTASWCVTCQANKLAVLDRENVQKAFKEHNVKFLIADWTNRNAEISKPL